MKGRLISFEGGDGAGKSTLMTHLHEKLLSEGLSVVQTRALSGTSFATKIRELLLHGEALCSRSELFLFLADRAHQVAEVIRPALEEGKIVLVDRFNDSTVAYQGGARGLNESFVRSLCLFATENLEPDITFYLDIDPRQGLLRVLKRSVNAKDRIESEEISFHEKIRSSYLAMASEDPKRIHQLDAQLSQDILLKQAMDIFYAVR